MIKSLTKEKFVPRALNFFILVKWMSFLVWWFDLRKWEHCFNYATQVAALHLYSSFGRSGPHSAVTLSLFFYHRCTRLALGVNRTRGRCPEFRVFSLSGYHEHVCCVMSLYFPPTVLVYILQKNYNFANWLKQFTGIKIY